MTPGGSGIEVRPAESRRDRARFVDFPYRLYRGHPHWVGPLRISVPPLLGDPRNPFWREARIALFLAEESSRTVGRIAAIEYPAHNRFWKDRVGFFGFFDAVDDPRVSRPLLDAAAAWLATRRFDRIRGPANPSTNHECGLLVDGFEHDNVLQMPYNHPYYARLLEDWGLSKEMDLYAYKVASTASPLPALERLVRRAERLGKIVVRNLDKKDFAREAERVREIYNDAWETNWGFVPLTAEEFDFIALDLRRVVRPEISYLALVEGEPAAFSIGLPNVNECLKGTGGRLFPLGLPKLLFGMNRTRSMRLITLGVKKKFQNRAIPAAFYMRTMVDCHRLGIDWGEGGWILENNVLMNRVLENLGALRYKTYRIYSAPLSGSETAAAR